MLASDHITQSDKLYFAFAFAALRMSFRSQWTINNIFFFLNESFPWLLRISVQVVYDITLGATIQIDYDVNRSPAVVKCIS